jgi:hypothetical protein
MRYVGFTVLGVAALLGAPVWLILIAGGSAIWAAYVLGKELWEEIKDARHNLLHK